MDKWVLLAFTLGMLIGGFFGWYANSPRNFDVTSSMACGDYCSAKNSIPQYELSNNESYVCYCDDRLKKIYTNESLMLK